MEYNTKLKYILVIGNDLWNFLPSMDLLDDATSADFSILLLLTASVLEPYGKERKRSPFIHIGSCRILSFAFTL